MSVIRSEFQKRLLSVSLRHQALDQAVKSCELESNPSSSCKLPKVTKKAIKPLEDNEIVDFLEAISGHTHPELRFHDLRHQYAVISIKNGDDIKTVQNNLGHASASFTLDVYGHVTEKMKQDSAIRMESFINSLSSLQ